MLCRDLVSDPLKTNLKSTPSCVEFRLALASPILLIHESSIMSGLDFRSGSGSCGKAQSLRPLGDTDQICFLRRSFCLGCIPPDAPVQTFYEPRGSSAQSRMANTPKNPFPPRVFLRLFRFFTPPPQKKLQSQAQQFLDLEVFVTQCASVVFEFLRVFPNDGRLVLDWFLWVMRSSSATEGLFKQKFVHFSFKVWLLQQWIGPDT